MNKEYRNCCKQDTFFYLGPCTVRLASLDFKIVIYANIQHLITMLQNIWFLVKVQDQVMFSHKITILCYIAICFYVKHSNNYKKKNGQRAQCRNPKTTNQQASLEILTTIVQCCTTNHSLWTVGGLQDYGCRSSDTQLLKRSNSVSNERQTYCDFLTNKTAT